MNQFDAYLLLSKMSRNILKIKDNYGGFIRGE